LANLRVEMWWKFHKLVLADEDDRPESLAVLSIQQKANLRIAREIAACLPLADTVLSDPLSSPQQAWWAMSQIVGRMAAVGTNPCPLKMDAYRHGDCQPQFAAAIEYVRGKLALISTEWDSPEFDRVGDGRYQRILPPDSPQSIYLELRSREGQSAEGLESWLRKASIASPDNMHLLAQWRVLGASVEALTPQDISARGLRADAIIFEVTSQRLELPQGLTDSFRPGVTLEVRGDASHAPAAIILHHRVKNAGAPPSTFAADD
jgi:predicted component of type VI protein secretion system